MVVCRVCELQKALSDKTNLRRGGRFLYIRKVSAHPQKALHSFRHTFIDLAREAGTTDVETRKFITGHSLGDVGEEYGSGPSMEKRLAVLNGIKHPWLT